MHLLWQPRWSFESMFKSIAFIGDAYNVTGLHWPWIQCSCLYHKSTKPKVDRDHSHGTHLFGWLDCLDATDHSIEKLGFWVVSVSFMTPDNGTHIHGFRIHKCTKIRNEDQFHLFYINSCRSQWAVMAWMSWPRIRTTPKIWVETFLDPDFFNYSTAHDINWLHVQAMQPFSVFRRLTKFVVQPILSKIRGSISEEGKYGVD